jgi:hypothetical protein
MTMPAPPAYPSDGPPSDPAQRGVVDATKGEAAAMADRAKQETSHLVDEARKTLRTQTDQQAGRVATGARDLARQLDDLASGRGGNDGPVANFARDAATRIDSVAERLDSDGIDGLTRDVKQFARRRPGTYLVSAFALGLVAGRVFRNADTGALAHAARPEPDPPTQPTDPSTFVPTQEDISWPTRPTS